MLSYFFKNYNYNLFVHKSLETQLGNNKNYEC